MIKFKKFLFRATRGKAWAKFYELDIPPQDKLKGMHNQKSKLVYICMFEEGVFLRAKMQKLLGSFMEPLFEILPE